MNILFITPKEPYPPEAGGLEVRTWPIIQSLSTAHAVDLLYLVRPDAPDVREPLEAVCRRVLGVPKPSRGFVRKLSLLPQLAPLKLSLHWSNGLRQVIRSWLAEKQYDLVFVVSLPMYHLLKDIVRVPMLVDLCDTPSILLRDQVASESAWLKKVYHLIDLLKMRRYERHALEPRHLYCVASDVDRQALTRGNPRLRVEVLANSIDLDFYRPTAVEGLEARVMFLGNMGYWPNEDAARRLIGQIFPRIREKNPDALLDIVGRHPSQQLRDADGRDGVLVTGSVEDTRTYYSRSAVFLCPLRFGSGIKNKLLEAMAMRVPVVCSPETLNGLPLRHGREVLVAQSDDEYASAALSLLEQPELGAALTERAFRFVQRNHSRESVSNLVLSLIENA